MEYQSYEDDVKRCTLQLLQNDALSYYAIHLYDSSEIYANKNMFLNAKLLVEEANLTLSSQNVFLSYIPP